MFGCCGVVQPSGVSENYCAANLDGFVSFLGITTLQEWLTTWRRRRTRSVSTLVRNDLDPPIDCSWTLEQTEEFQPDGSVLVTIIEKTPAEPEFTQRQNNMLLFTSDAEGTFNATPTNFHEVVNTPAFPAFLTHDVNHETPNPFPQDLIGLVNSFSPANVPIGQSIFHAAPPPFRNPLPDGAIGGTAGRMNFSVGGVHAFGAQPATGVRSGHGPHNPSGMLVVIAIEARNYRISSAAQWGKATKQSHTYRNPVQTPVQYFCLGQIAPPVNHIMLCEQAAGDADFTQGSVALFANQANAVCP